MDLSDIRDKINQVDAQLLPLFLERMDLARQVAEYKKENHLPILNKGREREILAQVMEQAGPEMEQYAHRLYQLLFELSRSYQETILHADTPVRAEIEEALQKPALPFPKGGSIAVQGVEGAYSQMAADRMFPRGNLVFFKSFEGVFEAVENGLCDFGVIPIENSTNGSVHANYELLRTHKVRIVRSTRLNVIHELLGPVGMKLEDITEIRSHEQALGQCSEFLKSLGDRVKVTPCANTAMAAELAASGTVPGLAAIASHSSCDNYELQTIATDIQNNANNYTRFICIARDTTVYPGSDHISLILACKHRPGALYEILSKLSAVEVNLIKLESYQIVGHDFEFMFFFEMNGSVADPKVASMLESLERDCEGFLFLGNYLEA